MSIEDKIRDDLWKSVQAHYERGDYTETVRDAIFLMSEVLREKSGIDDKDGTKLVDAALLGNNPAILVCKNETTTEKDYQQGIGFAFKGIMQSVRNRISHEKCLLTNEEAEALILYINYLLNQIDHSGGKTKIENVMELLLDEDFTDTQEYADLLMKEIPVKKRYDLLLELYKQKEELPQHKLKCFINTLFSTLTKASQGDFMRVVNSSMLKCKDNNELRMYFHYFMNKTYSELDRLVQLRMEDLVLKSVMRGAMENRYNPNTEETERYCNAEGSLATWINDKMDLLSNKEFIVKAIFEKLNGNFDEQSYAFQFFSLVISKKASDFTDSEIRIIKKGLKSGNNLFSSFIANFIELLEDPGYIELFDKEYKECKSKMEEAEQEEALPF